MFFKPENKALAALLLGFIGHASSAALPNFPTFDLSKRQDDGDIGPEATGKLRDANPPKPLYTSQDEVKWYERSDDLKTITNTVTSKKDEDVPKTKGKDKDDRFVVDHIIELQLLDWAFQDENRKLNDKSKKISDDAWKKARAAIDGDDKDNTKTLANAITVLDNLLGVSERINLGKEAVYTKVIKGNTNTDLDSKWDDYKKPIMDYLDNYSGGVEGVIKATGKAFDSFCDDGTNVSDYVINFLEVNFGEGKTYLKNQIDKDGGSVFGGQSTHGGAPSCQGC